MTYFSYSTWIVRGRLKVECRTTEMWLRSSFLPNVAICPPLWAPLLLDDQSIICDIELNQTYVTITSKWSPHRCSRRCVSSFFTAFKIRIPVCLWPEYISSWANRIDMWRRRVFIIRRDVRRRESMCVVEGERVGRRATNASWSVVEGEGVTISLVTTTMLELSSLVLSAMHNV
jgi:hypothetical protein